MGEFLLVILFVRLSVWLVNLMRKLVQSLTGLLEDLQKFFKTAKHVFKKQPDINKLDSRINTFFPGVLIREGSSDDAYDTYLKHLLYRINHPSPSFFEQMAMLNTNNKPTTSSK